MVLESVKKADTEIPYRFFLCSTAAASYFFSNKSAKKNVFFCHLTPGKGSFSVFFKSEIWYTEPVL